MSFQLVSWNTAERCVWAVSALIGLTTLFLSWWDISVAIVNLSTYEAHFVYERLFLTGTWVSAWPEGGSFNFSTAFSNPIPMSFISVLCFILIILGGLIAFLKAVDYPLKSRLLLALWALCLVIPPVLYYSSLATNLASHPVYVVIDGKQYALKVDVLYDASINGNSSTIGIDNSSRMDIGASVFLSSLFPRFTIPFHTLVLPLVALLLPSATYFLRHLRGASLQEQKSRSMTA